GHLDDNFVGIAVGHQTSKRAAASHAKSPGIVDHDQVDPTRLLALSTNARTSSATYDRPSSGNLLSKSFENGCSGFHYDIFQFSKDVRIETAIAYTPAPVGRQTRDH